MQLPLSPGSRDVELDAHLIGRQVCKIVVDCLALGIAACEGLQHQLARACTWAQPIP